MWMQELDDNALLREYVERDSEEAFAALVTRHVNKVYSVALRHARNPHQAEEITQAVFVILAKKSRNLGRGVVLSGWLYQTARLTAMTFIRSEFRRARREQEAHMQTLSNENESEVWPQIAPLLDTAMAGLSETDRHAVVLRFFDGRSMSEVGVALGASEDAAKKRVNRAVEKLRGFFTKRGVMLTATVLTAAISENSVQAAPTVLAKTITAVALTKGVAASGSTLTLIKGALKFMAWTKVKTTAVVGACVLLTAGTTTVIISNRDKPIQGIPKDWTVLIGNLDQWSWADGKINAHSTTGDGLLASSKKYGDVTLSAITCTTNRDACFAIRMQDADNGYFVLFVPDGTPWAKENGSHISLVKRKFGEEVELASFKRQGLAQSAKITVIAKGSRFEVRMNDVSILSATDTTFSSGFIGLRVYGDTTKPCDGTFSKLIIHE